MPSNIEIKARVADMDKLRDAAKKIATEPGRTLMQEDVFFRSRSGRLKLRILSENHGELIQYERPDSSEAKESRYQIYRSSEPSVLRQLLSDALSETVTVKKKREVYMAGQTRIHLDEVEDLGSFMELEVVMQPGQSRDEGRDIAEDLMRKLGIEESDLVSCAYADLLLAKSDEP